VPQEQILSDLLYSPKTKTGERWIWDLKDRHKGETAFIIGNGWSAHYYDMHRIKKETNAVFIGCNKAFMKWPIDYIVWQDNNVNKLCIKAPCTKIMPHRKLKLCKNLVDYDTTYFYGFGQYQKRFHNSSLELSNSGCVAFQLVHYMGFETLIIVGCDCEIIMVPNSLELHSNVFEDRQVSRLNTRAKNSGIRLEEVVRDGKTKYTSKGLLRFSKKFEELYGRFRDDMDIFRMGNHGILRLPTMEYEAFWSDSHPGRSDNSDRGE